jgi:hypothetical protein
MKWNKMKTTTNNEIIEVYTEAMNAEIELRRLLAEDVKRKLQITAVQKRLSLAKDAVRFLKQ